jgi:hypothetical protein
MIERITNKGMPLQNPITAARKPISFENETRFCQSQQKENSTVLNIRKQRRKSAVLLIAEWCQKILGINLQPAAVPPIGKTHP